MNFDRIGLEVVNSIKKVIKHNGSFIPMHAPNFNNNELNYVKECIDTNWVSSVGKYVDQFEDKIAKYIKAKRVIAVCNGTAALHACLIGAGVKENDEVIAPSLTF
jgi:perosamine synthetase